MQAYVHWVNAQLKKRPGSRVVDNLERDMRDGVAFLQLIEVIGDENVNKIEDPVSLSEMTSNVTRVLRFMAERKIKMHQINTKEIVEGNLKAIMRLILALAAHFKPGSVRPTNSSENSHGRLERASSTMSLAAEAAVALADASQMASSAGLSLHYKYRNRPNFDMQLALSDVSLNTPPPEAVHSRSSSSASNASHQSAGSKPLPRGGTLPRSKPKKKYGDLTPTERSRRTSMEVDRTQIDHRSHEKRNNPAYRQFSEDLHRNRVSRKLLSASKSEDVNASRKFSRPSSANSSTSIDDHILAEEHDHMVMEVKILKDCLLGLQQLLLEGDDTEDDDSNNNKKKLTHALSMDGAPSDEQVVVYKARLDQANKDYQGLQNNHSILKEEIVRLQGEKVGLQDRLTQMEQAQIDLRSDQLRQELACDSARTAKDSAQRIIDERERQITSLHEEIARKDQMVRNQNREIEQLLATLAGRENTEADRDRALGRQDFMDKTLQFQIEEITGRLEELSDSETLMNSQMDRYHNRLSKYEQAIARSLQFGDTREEFEKASSTLKNLRSSFGKHDPRQRAIDGVEQSLNIILQKAVVDDEAVNSLTPRSNLSRQSSGRMSRKEKLDEDSTIHHTPNGFIERTPLNKFSKRTKVLYFKNQSITPYLGFINKNLGDIKLKDFISMLDRPGNFRYFFKSVDPDFGSVREEIVSEDEIIPGWDGKIVSWIEEDKDTTKTQYEHRNYKTSNHVTHENGTQEDLV